MWFTAETCRVLEMQYFNPAYMKGWTYGRTILSEPKFLGWINNQIFLLTVLRYPSSAVMLESIFEILVEDK